MGDIRTISRTFTAVGTEGRRVNGISLRQAELLRKLPFGDRWTYLRVGLLVNFDWNGYEVRDGATPGSSFWAGVCSGPWGMGHSEGKTYRWVGVNFSGFSGFNGGYDWQNRWLRSLQSGSATDYWTNISNITRGCWVYLASPGSYATGGDPRERRIMGMANGGISISMSYQESYGTPRRHQLFFDIYKQPAGTPWQFAIWTYYYSTHGPLDPATRVYEQNLHCRTYTAGQPGPNENWYGQDEIASSGLQTGTTVDQRGAPLDYFNLYWDNPVLRMEIWRIDVLRCM